MRRSVVAAVLIVLSSTALAQTADALLPLEVAQQRARYAREQMIAAQRKAQSAQKKDKAAQDRLAQATSEAENAAALMREVQAEFQKARERHDVAYENLKRAHDALQDSNKRP